MGQTVGHSPFDFILMNLKEVQKKKMAELGLEKSGELATLEPCTCS